MATELYLSVAGSGAKDGSSTSNEFDWSTMVAAWGSYSDTVIHAKKGNYGSIGATTFPSGGTSTAWNYLRGYNSTPGDLQNLEWNQAEGELDDSNMPLVTITANWPLNQFCSLENFSLVGGSIGNYMMGTSSLDNFKWRQVKARTSGTGASDGVCFTDDNCYITKCDWASSATSGPTRMFGGDGYNEISQSRFRIALTSGSGSAYGGRPARFMDRNVWIGAGSGYGIDFDWHDVLASLSHNTFYNFSTAVRFYGTGSALNRVMFHNNHVTDCTNGITSLTASTYLAEANTRWRDVGTKRGSNLIHLYQINDIDTDTGDKDTDFTDADSGDFSLIAAAPGRNAGYGGLDVGAWQGSSGGGGSTVIVIED